MKTNKPEPELSYGWGYVIGQSEISYLEGRLLTLIDSLGLRETQEKAIKDLVKQEIWSALSRGLLLEPKKHTEIQVKSRKGGVEITPLITEAVIK